MNVQCFNSYDGSMEAFKDYSPANTVGRTWVWMTCNEPFFYYQTYVIPSHQTLHGLNSFPPFRTKPLTV